MGFTSVDVKKVEEDVGGSGVISESGIYPVTIKQASVSKTTNGATQVNFGFEGPAGSATVYGLIVLKKDGTENFGMTTLHSLMAILGIESLEDPTPEEFDFGGKKVTLDVFPEFTDEEVIVQLQREFTRYNGKVSSALKVKRFFRAADGATGSEIVQGAEPEQLGKLRDTADKDSYRDGVTLEEAEACLQREAEERQAKKSGSAGAKPAGASAPKSNPFAKK